MNKNIIRIEVVMNINEYTNEISNTIQTYDIFKNYLKNYYKNSPELVLYYGHFLKLNKITPGVTDGERIIPRQKIFFNKYPKNAHLFGFLKLLYHYWSFIQDNTEPLKFIIEPLYMSTLGNRDFQNFKILVSIDNKEKVEKIIDKILKANKKIYIYSAIVNKNKVYELKTNFNSDYMTIKNVIFNINYAKVATMTIYEKWIRENLYYRTDKIIKMSFDSTWNSITKNKNEIIKMNFDSTGGGIPFINMYANRSNIVNYRSIINNNINTYNSTFDY